MGEAPVWDQIVVAGLNGSVTVLAVCPTCRAVVELYNKQNHAAWHEAATPASPTTDDDREQRWVRLRDPSEWSLQVLDDCRWRATGLVQRRPYGSAAPTDDRTETRDALLLGLGVTYDGKPLDPAKVTLHYREGSTPADDRVREAAISFAAAYDRELGGVSLPGALPEYHALRAVITPTPDEETSR